MAGSTLSKFEMASKSKKLKLGQQGNIAETAKAAKGAIERSQQKQAEKEKLIPPTTEPTLPST